MEKALFTGILSQRSRFQAMRLVVWLITLSMFQVHTISSAVAALEFFSMADNAVIMYDAPSLKAEKIYVASQYLPVEAVVKVEGWVKVRDSGGGLAWVEKKALSDKRYVIVTVPLAEARQAAEASSMLVFQAQQNVVMEWLEPAVNGWIKVRHRDGQSGFVKTSQVWGS